MQSTLPAGLRLLPMERAATLVSRLGFVLVHDERLGDATAPSGSHLVVALRERPTMAHFDPERVTFYVTSGGRGQLVEFHRSRAPIDRIDIAWGQIHVIDRLEIRNAFLTFGGILRTAQVDAQTTVLVVDSAAPILRWSGHSQDVDPVAPEVAAFFARLMVPIDFTPGAEARIGALPPMALYAAFIASLHARCQASPALREAQRSLYDWLVHEAHQLATVHPDDWEAGRRMLGELAMAVA